MNLTVPGTCDTAWLPLHEGDGHVSRAAWRRKGRAWLSAAVLIALALTLAPPPVQAATTPAKPTAKEEPVRKPAAAAAKGTASKPAAATTAASRTAASKTAAAKGAAAKSAAPADPTAVLEKTLAVPVDQINSEDAHVWSGGRSFAPRDMDPNAVPRSVIMSWRRKHQGARMWAQRNGAPWSIAGSAAPGRFRGANGAPPAGTASAGSSSGASTSAAAAAADAPSPVRTYSLSYTFHAIGETPGSEAKPITFEAVVMVLKDLRYNESKHRFESQIAVGLADPNDPTNHATLGEKLSLLVSANADEVDPNKIEIGQLGDPQIVSISAAAPSAPFYVSAGTIGDTGDQIEIPVEKAQLTVQPAQQEIEGWGLAKTVLQIQVPGLSDSSPHAITLSTTQGEITPTPVTLDATGHARATLRSDGTGTATITAAGEPFAAGTATVSFATPQNFVFATLLGALLGWIVKIRARHWSFASFLVAIASSCILSAAYAAGIHWAKWAPEHGAGEALTFFVAAMGAYVGVRVLKRMGADSEEEDDGAKEKAKA